MLRYRQLDRKLPEAGGQLFGTVSEEVIRVAIATGPYVSDKSSRFCYRSNPDSAQRMIEIQFQSGFLYLGEWHTHAEDIPTPSLYDISAMNTLQKLSKLNTTSILLLIVGQRAPPTGINVTSFSQDGRIDWFSACYYK